MISTVIEYISRVKEISIDWEKLAKRPREILWFRGEPNVATGLVPKLFRKKQNGTFYEENKLLQMFRMRAATFTNYQVPDRGGKYIDQWLFLAQHVGIPTRLLDWSESSLVALYFAIQQDCPVVWVLDPMKLNQLSLQQKDEPIDFPLTWIENKYNKNIGHENIKLAWANGKDSVGLELPVAVHPSYIHPRMSAQRSVFTIHGTKKDSLKDLVTSDILEKIEIDSSKREYLRIELKLLGVEASTAFPDLDGLAKELSERY